MIIPKGLFLDSRVFTFIIVRLFFFRKKKSGSNCIRYSDAFFVFVFYSYELMAILSRLLRWYGNCQGFVFDYPFFFAKWVSVKQPSFIAALIVPGKIPMALYVFMKKKLI